MNPKEILNTFDKEELIDLIIQYSEEGYYPLELFLMRADCIGTKRMLEESWNTAYARARGMEEQKDDRGAALLGDTAEACFVLAKKLTSEAEKTQVCRMLISEMHRACEEDGIGMYGDSEWEYLEVCEEIEKYLGQNENETENSNLSYTDSTQRTSAIPTPFPERISGRTE